MCQEQSVAIPPCTYIIHNQCGRQLMYPNNLNLFLTSHIWTDDKVSQPDFHSVCSFQCGRKYICKINKEWSLCIYYIYYYILCISKHCWSVKMYRYRLGRVYIPFRLDSHVNVQRLSNTKKKKEIRQEKGLTYVSCSWVKWRVDYWSQVMSSNNQNMLGWSRNDNCQFIKD